MTEIGKVHEITKKFDFDFEWKIADFSSLSEQDEGYFSPSFLFANESWRLCICSIGNSDDNSSSEYLAAYLCKNSSDSTTISVTSSIGVKAADGKKAEEVQFTFDDDEVVCGPHVLLKRSELFQKKSYLMPSDILTIVCSLKYSKSMEDTDGTGRAECSYCKAAFDTEDISSHEDICLDKPIRCPTCDDDVSLRKWFEHECQMARVIANKKLLDDLTDILNNEEHSDVTIKVKGEEFRLHRNILSGRNAFFRSMFNSDMKEKTTGIVSIEDCEPDIFKSFICFLYTGKIQTLSNDNVCALYEMADKYQDDQLKTECLIFMKNKITTDSFCDFIVLALRHDAKDLLQVATELFCKKTIDIIQTAEWYSFMKEYPKQANELHIKAHKTK